MRLRMDGEGPVCTWVERRGLSRAEAEAGTGTLTLVSSPWKDAILTETEPVPKKNLALIP